MDPSNGHVNTIDAYIDSCAHEVRTLLHQLRQAIKEAAPEAEEGIKYRMPTFSFHGNLVYFAAWKHHIGLYPITAAMEAELKELATYKTSGKGTIHFPLDQPLPLPLIRTIVAFRVKENLERKEIHKG